MSFTQALNPGRRSPLTFAARLFCLLGVLAVAPKTASAQAQLLAIDETYTALEKDNLTFASFHHKVNPSNREPANWLTPIDYSKGMAYIRLEVFDKPSEKPTTLTICFDGDLALYGCFATPAWTTSGVHEFMKPVTSAFDHDKIQWNKRRTEYHLIIKDGSQRTPTPVADFVPTKLRVIMTIVPMGGTYVPPINQQPVSDGGASDARPDGGGDDARDGSSETGSADASTGAGGSAGSGGSGGGSGGSSGGTSNATGGTSGGSSTGGTSGGSGGRTGTGGSSGSGSGGSQSSPPSSGSSGGGCVYVASGADASVGAAALLLLTGLGLARRRRRRR